MENITNLKKYFFIFTFLVIATIIFLSGCTEKPIEKQDPVDLYSCDKNSDCILVLTNEPCCNYYISINKKYEDYWVKKKGQYSDTTGQCEIISCALPIKEYLTPACQQVSYETGLKNCVAIDK